MLALARFKESWSAAAVKEESTAISIVAEPPRETVPPPVSPLPAV